MFSWFFKKDKKEKNEVIHRTIELNLTVFYISDISYVTCRLKKENNEPYCSIVINFKNGGTYMNHIDLKNGLLLSIYENLRIDNELIELTKNINIRELISEQKIYMGQFVVLTNEIDLKIIDEKVLEIENIRKYIEEREKLKKEYNIVNN